MKNKKVLLTSIIAVALLTVVTIGITIATLADKTQTLTNTFEPGSVTTEIDEPDPDEGEVKKCRVKNTGKLDCLVRARVTISPAEAENAIELLETENTGWVEGEDGYLYYKAVLPPDKGDGSDDHYTNYIFNGIKVDNNNWNDLGIDTFDITVYEESVQVNVHNGTEVISALDNDGNYDHNRALAVWKVYEASKANN